MKSNRNRRWITILTFSAVLIIAVAIYTYLRSSGNSLNSEFANTSQENPEPKPAVQQEPILTDLPENATPVSAQSGELPVVQRDDISITIDKVVPGKDNFRISYTVRGLPHNIFSPEHSDAYTNSLKSEPQPDQIRLPNDTILPFQGGSICEGAGDLVASWITCHLVFPALPENVNTITLEIDRVNNALPGEFPENWIIPIPLSQAYETASTDTVIEELNLCSEEIENIRICLLKTSQTSKESTFYLSMRMQLQEYKAYPHNMPPITLTDSKGKYYILSGGHESGHYSAEDPSFATLSSLVTGPMDGSELLTFRLDWVTLNFNDSKAINFSPQADAVLGQEWNINQSIQVAGYSLDILKARLKNKNDTEQTFEFEIKMSEELTGVSMSANTSVMSFEDVYDNDRNLLLGRLTVPINNNEKLEFYISDVFVKINGPWEIAWQPSKTEFSEPSQTKVIPTRMAPEIDLLQSENPLLIELSDYINQAYSTYNQPGWIVQKMERESPETETLLGSKDQTTTPPHIKIETWMHLDENGFIDTRITIIKTTGDEIFSINIDKENVHFTLPDGLGGISPDIYMEKPTLDLHAISQINGYLRENGQLTKTPTQLNTIDCLLYEATRPYNPPIDFSNHPKPVIQMSLLIWINPDTGEILQKQNTITYEDGALKITNTEYNISAETIDSLPVEVQNILDSIVIP